MSNAKPIAAVAVTFLAGIGTAALAITLTAAPARVPCADPFSPSGQVDTSHLWCVP